MYCISGTKNRQKACFCYIHTATPFKVYTAVMKLVRFLPSSFFPLWLSTSNSKFTTFMCKIWQRATPFSVGQFTGCTCTNNHMQYSQAAHVQTTIYSIHRLHMYKQPYAVFTGCTCTDNHMQYSQAAHVQTTVCSIHRLHMYKQPYTVFTGCTCTNNHIQYSLLHTSQNFYNTHIIN